MDCQPFFSKVERSIKFCLVALSSGYGTCSSLHPAVSLASLDHI